MKFTVIFKRKGDNAHMLIHREKEAEDNRNYYQKGDNEMAKTMIRHTKYIQSNLEYVCVNERKGYKY